MFFFVFLGMKKFIRGAYLISILGCHAGSGREGAGGDWILHEIKKNVAVFIKR
jgi:hypothetical protein